MGEPWKIKYPLQKVYCEILGIRLLFLTKTNKNPFFLSLWIMNSTKSFWWTSEPYTSASFLSGCLPDSVRRCVFRVRLQLRCHYNDHTRTCLMLLPLPLAAAGIMSRWWVTPWQQCNSITQQQQTQTWRSAVWWSREETNVLFGCLAAPSFVWTPFSHQLCWFSPL